MSRRTEQGLSFFRFILLVGIIAAGVYLWRPDLLELDGISIDTPTNLVLGKGTTAITDLREIHKALVWYGLEFDNYPSEAQGLGELVDNPQRPFLKDKKTLIDPWGQPYRYSYPGTHELFDVYTLGADGRPGGEGENKDLGNWQFTRK